MNERQTDAIDAYAAKLERENAKLKAIIKNGPKVAKKFAHDYGYMTDPFELRKALRDMMDMNATLMAKNNRIVSESKRMEEWNNKLVKEHYELKKQPAPDYSSWKCPICGLSSNYTTNRCADQKCGGRREQVPAPAPRVTDILEALRDYRCQYTRDADGNGLSLVDMLTPDYESDITNGISEMEILADDIEAHLLDKQPAPKATDAPMTLDGVTAGR